MNPIRPSLTLAFLAVFASLCSCGDDEPLASQVPFDVPPVVLLEEVVPSNDAPIVVDRSSDDTLVTFTAPGVTELNLEDEVRYEFSVATARPTGHLVLDSGTLAPLDSQPSPDTTVFERLSYTFDFCGDDFIEWSEVVIRLRFTDQIPESQHEMFGFTEHSVNVSWFVVPQNMCSPER